MNHLTNTFSHTLTAMMHALVGMAGRVVPDRGSSDADGVRREDRGAVSIETVLWYAAAAVSVAVVAGIIWSQIRSTASTGVDAPTAP